MTMQRWDPFGEMLSLRQAMDRLMEDAFVWPGRSVGGASSGMAMPIDLEERGDEFVLKASLPGVRPEDVNLSVQGNLLTLEGECREESESPQREEQNGQQTHQAKEGNGASPRGQNAPRYHYRERRYGRFFRQMTLPAAVDSEKAEARFEHGVLTVTLPKAPEARQRRISVRGGQEAHQLSAGSTKR